MSDVSELKKRRGRRRPPRAIAGTAELHEAGRPLRMAAWILGGVLIWTLLVTTLRPIMDPDTWFHLAFGKLAVESGNLPRTDVFSHTSHGNEWISSGWLSSILLYKLYTISESGQWMVYLSCAIVLLTYGLAFLTLWRGYHAPHLAALLLVIGAGFAAVRFSPRPDIFSQLGISLLLLVLLWSEKLQAVPKRAVGVLWLLPLLLAAWANLHAGFVIAFLVLGLFGAWHILRALRHGEKWRWWSLLPLAVACVAWVANPYGLRLLELPRKIQQIPDVEWIQEWMPLFKKGFLPGWQPMLLLGSFAALACVAAWRGRRALAGWQWGVLLLFTILALLQRRQAGLASIAIPLVLAPALQATELTWSRVHSWITKATLAAGLVVTVFMYRGDLVANRGLFKVGLNCSSLPCDATDYMLQNPVPPNLYNAYGAGGYFLFHLGPQTRVYIDGRLDVYDHQVWQDYLAVEELRLPLADFEKKYGIQSWAVHTKDSVNDPLHMASRLAADANYALVYFDDQMCIFIKRSVLAPPHQAFSLVQPWNMQALLQLNPDQELMQAASNEAARAIQLSNGSAAAWALGALLATRAEDREMAEQSLAQAAARDPKNEVYLAVKKLLAR